MLKQRRTQISLAIGAGVLALLAGIGISTISSLGLLARLGQGHLDSGVSGSSQVKAITALQSLPPQQRTEKLQALATSKASPDRNRARYLLANELLQQGQASRALEQLQGLDADYPVLAAQVLSKRAQAYEQMGDRAKAEAVWQDMLKRYPQDPATAEALTALGQTNSKYWDQAIAQFPSHPRTIDVVQKQLKQNPKQPQLLLVLAKHALYVDNYIEILDQLSEQYAAQLTPQDWEAIAFGYWEKQLYGKAGAAYARAPFTSRNAYRTARGLQLGERPGVIAAYQRVVQAFPDAPEAAEAMIRLSRITEPNTAIAYTDQIVSRFPDRAGEALLEKAKLLDKPATAKLALQVRQLLLSRYGKTEAAAELRWTLAQERATARDYETAWKWADSILSQNPDSEQAPEAGFWMGKWAQQLGKSREAQAAFENVLKRYPESYYAWRSASLLGWQVGDFNSVRQLNPSVARPAARPELPTGSDALKELHLLGQDRDAWRLWQVEFKNPMQPTVAEQFTDGVMRLGVGDYLDGIFMVSFLSERETPEEKSEYQSLKRDSSYWQALYPFPFLEPIEAWSQERQLNPLLVTALIRQESRFMPGIRSGVGATGLMQVMPDTGAWIAEKIKLKQYQLNDPEDNIKLGTWYLDYTHQEYSGNSLLAIASYNAGPGAVSDWVAKNGLTDPDTFVETIPYDETRGYVKSVFGNYWNYLRLYNPDISQKLAQISDRQPTDSQS